MPNSLMSKFKGNTWVRSGGLLNTKDLEISEAVKRLKKVVTIQILRIGLY